MADEKEGRCSQPPMDRARAMSRPGHTYRGSVHLSQKDLRELLRYQAFRAARAERERIERAIRKKRAPLYRKMREMSRNGHGINAGIYATQVQMLDEAILLVRGEGVQS